MSAGLAPDVLDQAYERDYSAAGSARTGYVNDMAKALQRLRVLAQHLHELERYTHRRGRLLDFG